MGSICNVGRKERMIRLVLGAGLVTAALLSPLGPTARWVILGLGVLTFVQGIVRF